MAAGTLTIDRYVVDTLMRDLVGHDRRPAAFLVYLYLLSKGRGGRGCRLSHQQIADETGLSKSASQGAIRLLVRRRLVRVARASKTATPEYTALKPWRR